jgi:hypothetical protein
MPRRKSSDIGANIGDYRYNKSAKRKNNPPAGLVPTFEPKLKERKFQKYQYGPPLTRNWSGQARQNGYLLK